MQERMRLGLNGPVRLSKEGRVCKALRPQPVRMMRSQSLDSAPYGRVERLVPPSDVRLRACHLLSSSYNNRSADFPPLNQQRITPILSKFQLKLWETC